jgi:hypothetical protein
MLKMTFQLSARLKYIAVQYWTTSKNNPCFPLLSQRGDEQLARPRRARIVQSSRPGSVQEQATTESGATNSQYHFKRTNLGP